MGRWMLVLTPVATLAGAGTGAPAAAAPAVVRDCRLEATFRPAAGRTLGHAVITFTTPPADGRPTSYLHGELRLHFEHFRRQAGN